MSTALLTAAQAARKSNPQPPVLVRLRNWILSALGAPDRQGLGYFGAERGRKGGNWTPATKSANAEVRLALPDLRNRSRDLLRNNAYATRAIESILGNVVAEGIWPQSATGNGATDDAVDALFRRWSKECDASGTLQWPALVRLVLRAALTDGDVLVRRRRRMSKDDLSVPLQLQALEADHLVTNAIGTGSNRIVEGVELDALDRRQAYHLYRVHPGEQYSPFGGSLGDRLQTTRVRASEIAHVFRQDRPGQVRGVPVTAPVIMGLRDIGDFIDNELERKKMESCLVGFVYNNEANYQTTGQDGVVFPVQDADGNFVETFERGLIAMVRGDKKIDIHEPSAVPNFEEWMRVMLRQVSAGLGVPYEVVTGDLSGVNYSSIRTGLLEYRRSLRALRNTVLIPMFCDRVWGWFIEAAIFGGQLPDGVYPVKWSQPRFESIDPVKDANAAKLRLRLGLTSLPQEINDDGGDPEAVIAEQSAHLSKAAAAGLMLDSYPAHDIGRMHGAEIPLDAGND